MARIYFVVVGKTLYETKHIKIFETVQKSKDKIVSREVPEYGYWFAQLHIQGPCSDTPGF